jgi:hypothetical protein
MVPALALMIGAGIGGAGHAARSSIGFDGRM